MGLESPLEFHPICNVVVARLMALHYGNLPNAYSRARFAPMPIVKVAHHPGKADMSLGS